MRNFEKVEKLREKANVTYEEAKAALEATEWDLLDAVVLLEQEGKVNRNSAHHSTKEEPAEEESAPKKEKRVYMRRKIVNILKNLLRIGCENQMIISRKGEQVVALPVIAVIVLLLCTNLLVPILLVVGLFFGFRYSFKGAELGKESINNAMNKAADMAETMKESVGEELNR